MWKRVLYIFYPFLIGFLLPLMFFTEAMTARPAKAGVIRSAELSPDHPLVVRLAQGRSTAISFTTKPEKVVPGNPQALEINFLGHDLTLRPIGGKPGNLIVYTKSNRFVILLQLVSDTIYDDAVTVNNFASSSRPIRLAEDTFLLEDVHLFDPVNKTDTTISTLVKREGRILESDFFPENLRCTGCVLRKKPEGTLLLCNHPIETLDCKVAGTPMQLKRSGKAS